MLVGHPLAVSVGGCFADIYSCLIYTFVCSLQTVHSKCVHLHVRACKMCEFGPARTQSRPIIKLFIGGIHSG